MAQFLRPSSDTPIISGWTRSSGTNAFYTYIDEITADSTDYIQTQNQNNLCDVNLSAGVDPQTGTGHILRVQVWSLGSGAAERHSVSLYRTDSPTSSNVFDSQVLINGATLVRNTPTIVTYTLTAAQANAITDYANLRLRFSAGTLGAGETYRVGWAALEIPDAPVKRIILIT
jgi:hypothetical protein